MGIKMKIGQCIYCGVSDDLSKSDIIPDALTNARITNNNVCRVEHNNKFSDLFESKVISELAFISNTLDIKSSKANKYATYPALVKIDEKIYDINMRSEKSITDGRVIKTSDKKHSFTYYEKAIQIANNPDLVTPIDINNMDIETNIKINLGIYFDEAMFRMISKISYEWYCAINNISGYHEEFSNIVMFITTGNGYNPVKLIQNDEIYKCILNYTDLGSHCLFGFKDPDGKLIVFLSLFGIVIYKIIVSEHVPCICKNNFIYQELRTDSSRREVIESSHETAEYSLYSFINNSDNFQSALLNGIKVAFCTNPLPIDIPLYCFVLDAMMKLHKEHDEIITPNKQIISILNRNIETMIQTSLLHKKSLIRIVNDYFYEGHAPIKINPNSGNKKTLFLLFILMKIGVVNLEKIDDKSLNKIVKQSLEVNESNEIVLNDKLIKKLETEILKTLDYAKLMERGATIVKTWIKNQ